MQELDRIHELQQQIAIMELELELLVKSCRNKLIKQGIAEITTGKVKAKLGAKRGKKATAQFVEPERAAELREAIQAEQSEMLDVNADELYRLEKLIFDISHSAKLEICQLEQQKSALLTNDWISDMEAELSELKPIEVSVAAEKVLSIKPIKGTNYVKQLSAEQVATIETTQNGLKTKVPSARIKQVAMSVIAGGLDFDELWSRVVQLHREYWNEASD